MLKKNKNRYLIYWSKTILIAIMINLFILPVSLRAEVVYRGGDAEVTNLSEEIKAKQDKIKELSEKIEAYDKSIKQYRNQAVSLTSQVNYLTARIEKTEAEIERTENQVVENALQIQDVENKIRQNKSDIQRQKKILKNFIQEMYKADQESNLEVLLGYNSISDFYNNLRSLSILQNRTKDSLKSLKGFKEELTIQMTELENKKISLKNLKNKLEKNKETLEEQKITKQNILSQTRNSEYRFQSLLAQVKAEQASINTEIVSLEKKIREKLAGANIDKLKLLGKTDFVWPVPNRGITAYFHDPDYPFRYLFEHPAIDIRAKQGTPIRAAASGYVGRVKFDGSTRYAYIMLIHTDGFSTVYAHISKPFVKEDQFVTQGEVIALSGGMPGTPGAGRLSTGPHLHFEIRKNGIPVNPLNYLP